MRPLRAQACVPWSHFGQVRPQHARWRLLLLPRDPQLNVASQHPWCWIVTWRCSFFLCVTQVMRKLHGASQHRVASQHPGLIPTHPNVASQHPWCLIVTWRCSSFLCVTLVMRKLHGASQHPVARQHSGLIPTHPNVASQHPEPYIMKWLHWSVLLSFDSPWCWKNIMWPDSTL